MHIYVWLNHFAVQQKLTHCKSIMCSNAQSCPALCDPMDYILSSVHGIFQARIQELVAISSSRGSSRPRDWTRLWCSALVSRFFPDTWEAPGRFFTTEPRGGPLFTILHSLLLHKIKYYLKLQNTTLNTLILYAFAFDNKKLEKHDALMINLPSLYFWKKKPSIIKEKPWINIIYFGECVHYILNI